MDDEFSFRGYIVLEYLGLGSLQQQLYSKSPLYVGKKLLLKIAKDILTGLAYLHHNKITHLDLKPGNVMMVNLSSKSPVCCKLVDFGISRLAVSTGRTTTKGEYTAGTLLYMAPETFESNVWSPKSDIYCFGVVSCECRRKIR